MTAQTAQLCTMSDTTNNLHKENATVAAMTVVYGYSDDLIEIEGPLTEELSARDHEDGDILAFSTGVVLRVRYDNDGVWRITPLSGADQVTIEQAPADDDDNYSDRATLAKTPAWVLRGTDWIVAEGTGNA